MTRLLLPPGTALVQGDRRLDGANLFQAALSTSGVTSATSQRATATATASASTNTLGSWVELVTATADTVEWIEIAFMATTSTASTATQTLLNIGVGASGSEVAVISNIQAGWQAAGAHMRFPLHVPAGSRIAIQCQSAVVSKTVQVIATLYGAIYGKGSPSSLVTMGANTATSRGTALTAGGTINTKTAWTQIASSTTQPFGAMFVSTGMANDTVVPNSTFLVDIAVGSAGNEVAIVKDICYFTTTSEQLLATCNPLFPVAVPLGSALSARWAFSDNTGSCDIILIGVPRQ